MNTTSSFSIRLVSLTLDHPNQNFSFFSGFSLIPSEPRFLVLPLDRLRLRFLSINAPLSVPCVSHCRFSTKVLFFCNLKIHFLLSYSVLNSTVNYENPSCMKKKKTYFYYQCSATELKCFFFSRGS